MALLTFNCPKAAALATRLPRLRFGQRARAGPAALASHGGMGPGRAPGPPAWAGPAAASDDSESEPYSCVSVSWFSLQAMTISVSVVPCQCQGQLSLSQLFSLRLRAAAGARRLAAWGGAGGTDKIQSSSVDRLHNISAGYFEPEPAARSLPP